MSANPFFFLERKTDKGWEPINLFRNKEDKEPVDLFPFNTAYNVFDILRNRSNDYPELYAVKRRLPRDVSNYINQIWLETREAYVQAYYINYADIVIYLLKYPTVKVYNEDNDAYEEIPNPLFQLNKRIEAFLNIWDTWGWEDSISDTRLVFWII